MLFLKILNLITYLNLINYHSYIKVEFLYLDLVIANILNLKFDKNM